MAKDKKEGGSNTVARNRRARHNYFIEDTLEAGIVLTGTEVKSLREGRASLNEAFAREKDGEIWLEGMHIPEYRQAAQHANHEPVRSRKLLLHDREIRRLIGASQRQGQTMVPLSIYFNRRGIAKVELALARGKQDRDKRQTIKDREWNRQKHRVLRDRG